MSKSVGNILAIQDVLKTHDWESVRAFLVSVHYRSPIDFSEQSLLETREALERYYSTVKRAQEYLATSGTSKGRSGLSSSNAPTGLTTLIDRLLPSFREAMDDDFNTASVLGLLFEAVRGMNKAFDQSGSEKLPWLEALSRKFLESCDKIHSVLGCFGTDAEGFFNRQKERGVSKAGIDEAAILKKIEEREQARVAKDFKKADEIRNELLSLNVVLKDRPDGTTEWSVKTG
jgi:cysteinyl-tRNA synthetase